MGEKVVITVNEGKVRGIKQKSTFSGIEYCSFFGIPYGQPPKGNYRFQDPIKVKPWKTILDATKEKDGCVQWSYQTYHFMGTEDCLYNNIHTTKLPCEGEPLKPVIVNIHPGAFVYGSPDPGQYGDPRLIMHHDIVYVGIAHRLHVLGYLNLRMQECSGNQGIKDIILGLEWVKNNIHSFGGNPDNITLIGNSSGGIIIQILMLSPKCKNLFHKVVIMGNYLFSPVLQMEEENTHYAIDMAKRLGYKADNHDYKKLLLFLKKVPPGVLVQQSKVLDKEHYLKVAAIFPCCVFLPTLDHGEDPVLPQHPRNLLQSMMKIPVMFGVTERESVMGFCRGDLKLGTHDHFATSYCQNCWGWGYQLSEERVRSNYEKIKEFYKINDPIENVSLSVKVDIQTDAVLSDVYDTLIDFVAVDLPSSVYVYKFEFEGKIKCTKDSIGVLLREPLQGSFHGSDYSYWTYVDDPHDDATHKMIENFTKLICTFAETGNPNYENCHVHWRPSIPHEPCYLSIDVPLKMVNGRLNHKRLIFWDNLKKSSKNEII